MGIIANSYDFLLPPKRERKQAIPFNHGSYDYTAKWYNERILRLRCIWISASLKKLSRADIREISYWLSQKGQITLDIEPDKYYVGEIYDSNELTAHYNYAKELNDEINTTDGEFELDFICEPFAYGRDITMDIETGRNEVEYRGTAEAPSLIILKNNNNIAVNNVQIIVKRRKT